MSKKKRMIIYNSYNLLSNYEYNRILLTVNITGGHRFTGTIKWFDTFILKIRLGKEEGSITIPLHNIIYYECGYFQRKNKLEQIDKVYRNVPKPTHKEKEQLSRYKKKKELIHFYMEDGTEVRGRFQWYIDPVYCIRPDEGDRDFMIIKRHILYYRKVRPGIDK